MKKLIILLSSVLLICCLTVRIKGNEIKVIDEANVLDVDEEKELTERINSYIKHTDFDMVIYLANHNDYFDNYDDAITRLADDTFDYNGYGIGNERDGIILCIDFYYRDYTITTHGTKCNNTYKTNELNTIYEKVTPLLQNNNVSGALSTFVDSSRKIYDNSQIPEKKDIEGAIIPSLIISAIITLFSYLFLSSKLKSERTAVMADHYIKNPKFNLMRNGEVYLYTNITRTKISNDNNTDSSPTHVSSSGETHGGGGSHKF